MEETDDAAETVLEQKIMSMRRDPLFVLNPLPSSKKSPISTSKEYILVMEIRIRYDPTR